MKIRNIFENDSDHLDALNTTGFWGTRGAGVLIFSESTQRFFFLQRSELVQEPYTWALIGGAIDPKENPKEAVVREVHEEVGIQISSNGLKNLYTFNHSETGFIFHNYIYVIENEFEPSLNWENRDYIWVNYGDWPSPLHFGVQKFMNDKKAQTIMYNLMISDDTLNSENE